MSDSSPGLSRCHFAAERCRKVAPLCGASRASAIIVFASRPRRRARSRCWRNVPPHTPVTSCGWTLRQSLGVTSKPRARTLGFSCASFHGDLACPCDHIRRHQCPRLRGEFPPETRCVVGRARRRLPLRCVALHQEQHDTGLVLARVRGRPGSGSRRVTRHGPGNRGSAAEVRLCDQQSSAIIVSASRPTAAGVVTLLRGRSVSEACRR